MNQYFAYKTQVSQFWLNFSFNMNQSFAYKTQVDFDWFVNNLIVHNLFANYVNFNPIPAGEHKSSLLLVFLL